MLEPLVWRGWGCPFVVAAICRLGLDLFKAGQVLGLLSACAALWCAFRVHRLLLGPALAFLSVLLLAANPTFLANTYEVGTDMFFFAATIGSIALLLGTERPGWKALL